MKKTLILLFSILYFSSSIIANPFNKNLSSKERAKLEKGEVLIRNLDSIKELCINETPQTKRIISAMKELKPKYVAEVIQIRPYKGNEDLQDKMNSVLINISDYVGIPYFSERTQKFHELYSYAEIKNATIEGQKTTIYADMEMSLFGRFDTQIDIEETPDYYFYLMKNLDKLRYHDKFTAIGPENMQSCINLFRDGDNWVLYAIGGVDTFKIFFLEDRVETSFINRIKTFCNFIFDKI